MPKQAMTTSHRPQLLMCPPEHFGVEYTINPWMDPNGWARDSKALAGASRREWSKLYRKLTELGAEIELVPPAAGLPDLVFTANAAVVLDRKVLLASFRHPERQGEEALFEAAFRRLQAQGMIDQIRRMPEGVVLEGAGDCVWDDTRDLFWMGHGPRSSRDATGVVNDVFAVETIPLELADPRFYHLDTALCPLPGGEVMFAPVAFTPFGIAAIHEHVRPEQRVEIGTEDACRLAANAVALGDTVVMSNCSDRLRAMLAERGYRVATVPLGSFLRSGGSAFCLTLRLDRSSDGGKRAREKGVAA